jgi:hypothetical protein
MALGVAKESQPAPAAYLLGWLAHDCRKTEEDPMAAMNVVHMRVKAGREEEFLAINRDFENLKMVGLRNFWIVKTGERDFIVVGEWNEMSDLVRARPEMIASLDRQRSLLEDLGGGRGVTEPWSGEVSLHLRPEMNVESAL